MPFTFSHPAIILPLNFFFRKRLSLTGLIIGSMAPDFEYFLRMKIKSNYSHTLDGILWFNLPLSIILAFIFHNIVRQKLSDNLPIVLKSRFSQFGDFDWNRYFVKNWFIVVISILIGCISHVFWDSFTHDSGYFVEVLPFLSKSLIVLNKEVSVLKILQHSSSIIGMIFIVYSIYKIPTIQIKTEYRNLKYWITIAVITVLIVFIRISCGLDIKQFGNVIVTTISAVLISFVLTSFTVKKHKTNT